LYEDIGEGVAMTRPRTDLHAPTAEAEGEYYRFKTMGGIHPAREVYALRINSDILRWVQRDEHVVQEKLPRARGDRYVGLVLLFDATDGTPLAIMPDGYVQKLRVGATSAIGAKYLAREDAETVGLLGAGWQAQGQIAALNEVMDVEHLSVYTPSDSKAEFAERVEADYGIDADPVDSAEAVFDADVVHSATNSRSPVFDVDWLSAGTHLGVINRTEIPPETLEVCDVTVVHSKAGKAENYRTDEVDESDIPYLGTEGYDYEQYPDLGDLLVGNTPGRTDDEEVTFFFNNIGMGAQFAAVGAVAYERALATDRGRELETDLFTQALVP
ncbi:MAG: ornithine cyclodeaminase family protein, partial [archaeon]